MNVVKAIEKLAFNLLPPVNSFGLEVGVPIKGVAFKRAYKLFDHEMIISVVIIAGSSRDFLCH